MMIDWDDDLTYLVIGLILLAVLLAYSGYEIFQMFSQTW